MVKIHELGKFWLGTRESCYNLFVDTLVIKRPLPRKSIFYNTAWHYAKRSQQQYYKKPDICILTTLVTEETLIKDQIY